MKRLMMIVLAMAALNMQLGYAANKESGSAKAIKKLQMMVKDATAERDRLTTDNAKLTADLDQLKKQLDQEKKAKVDLESKEKKLNSELATQKSHTDEVRSRLDSTTVRLKEVIEKYNALNQAKAELASEHTNLQNTQQFTASELKACESKNMKMFEGAKQVIAGYERCQNKGMFDNIIDSEPVTQINNVGFEKVVQEYEDKLTKQKFYPSTDPKK